MKSAIIGVLFAGIGLGMQIALCFWHSSDEKKVWEAAKTVTVQHPAEIEVLGIKMIISVKEE